MYRKLPLSILVFKDKELVHINKYLLEMFCIDELLIDLKEIKTEIYYHIFEQAYGVEINNDEALLEQLLKQEELNYKQQNIQLDLFYEEEFTVFILTLIKPKESSKLVKLTENLSNETKIYDIFSKTQKRSFRIFSMYKGLHINSDALLIEVDDEHLVFKVSKKHLCSFKDNNEFIITPHINSKNAIVSKATKVDISKQLLYLSHLQNRPLSAKNRRTIRIKPHNEPINIHVHHEVYSLYDISLFSLSFLVKTDNALFNEEKKVYDISFKLNDGEKTSEISIKAEVEKIMPHGEERKIVLSFLDNEHAKQSIKHYINFRQMEILRELKSVVEKIELS